MNQYDESMSGGIDLNGEVDVQFSGVLGGLITIISTDDNAQIIRPDYARMLKDLARTTEVPNPSGSVISIINTEVADPLESQGLRLKRLLRELGP